MLNQVGTRVIPQIKKFGLWEERERDEKGKSWQEIIVIVCVFLAVF